MTVQITVVNRCAVILKKPISNLLYGGIHVCMLFAIILLKIYVHMIAASCGEQATMVGQWTVVHQRDPELIMGILCMYYVCLVSK